MAARRGWSDEHDCQKMTFYFVPLDLEDRKRVLEVMEWLKSDAAEGVFLFKNEKGMHCSDKKTAALLRLMWG